MRFTHITRTGDPGSGTVHHHLPLWLSCWLQSGAQLCRVDQLCLSAVDRVWEESFTVSLQQGQCQNQHGPLCREVSGLRHEKCAIPPFSSHSFPPVPAISPSSGPPIPGGSTSTCPLQLLRGKTIVRFSLRHPSVPISHSTHVECRKRASQGPVLPADEPLVTKKVRIVDAVKEVSCERVNVY